MKTSILARPVAHGGADCKLPSIFSGLHEPVRRLNLDTEKQKPNDG